MEIKRKTYIPPTIEENNIDTSPIMLALSMENPDIMIDGDKSINTRDEQLGRKRRGTWGNLWSDNSW